MSCKIPIAFKIVFRFIFAGYFAVSRDKGGFGWKCKFRKLILQGFSRKEVIVLLLKA